MVSWFNPSQKFSFTDLLLPSGAEERTRKVTGRKYMG